METKQGSLAASRVSVATPGSRRKQYEIDRDYVLKMQPIAIHKFYAVAWPTWEVIELDNNKANPLKVVLDIGGADKMLRSANGRIAFLAQRFRRYVSWHPKPNKVYDDFTLRYTRPFGHETEMEKLKQAMIEGGFVATWYAYGHANRDDTGFERFRILQLPSLLHGLDTGEIIYKLQDNHDGSSTFAYIPFQSIPRAVFLLDFPSYQLHLLDEVTK